MPAARAHDVYMVTRTGTRPPSLPDFSLYADGRAIVGNRSPVAGRCAATGGDIATAERLAGKDGQWTDHGRAYRVRLRPLLPDEPGCAALA